MQFPGRRIRFQEGTVATIVSVMDETIKVGRVSRTIGNHAVEEPWMKFPGRRVKFQEGTVAT